MLSIQGNVDNRGMADHVAGVSRRGRRSRSGGSGVARPGNRQKI